MTQMSLKAAVKSVERKAEGKVTVENTREESLADLSAGVASLSLRSIG